MKSFYFACLWLLLCSSSGMAQSNTHQCKVSLFDLNIDDIVTLGKFTPEAKNEPVIKSFKFMDTKLFVTASYYYKQGNPQDAADRESEIILMLILGKNPYKSLEEFDGIKDKDVITSAVMSVPSKSFEKATLDTMYLKKSQPVFISLECEKQ